MSLINSLFRVRSSSTHANIVKFNFNKMESYKETLVALNSLQSNAAYIHNVSLQSSTYKEDYNRTIVYTRMLLSKIGIQSDDLNKLSIIHVSGTKGKGSTCAYTESILRQHGYKTGFYSSPHLLEVRERIRINGTPLPHSKFSKYFWEIFPILKDIPSESPENFPIGYFRFLTLMALRVFMREKVDVAILEVGIGGEFDTTNVVEKVPIVGITSLGIDHTSLLGDTIEKIAWQKGGIIKRHSNAFTVPQPIEATKVLMERAEEKKAHLHVIQPFLNTSKQANSYPDVSNINASLAVVLAHSWIKHIKGVAPPLNEFLHLPQTEKGISEFSWPGRYQMLNHKKCTYFLDGAHTMESIMLCKKWFEWKTSKSPKRRALIFNTIGQRDSEKMLAVLMLCDFDKVIFTPNISGVSTTSDNNTDSSSKYTDRRPQHKDIWLKLLENNFKKAVEENILILPDLLTAVNYLSSDEYDCLVTGSLHLMGAALEVLDPELKMLRNHIQDKY